MGEGSCKVGSHEENVYDNNIKLKKDSHRYHPVRMAKSTARARVDATTKLGRISK